MRLIHTRASKGSISRGILAGLIHRNFEVELVLERGGPDDFSEAREGASPWEWVDPS